MALSPEEIKSILKEAKDDDSPRNAARKILVQAYEQMADAVAQGLPPWDRRWLEFAAVDAIAAALGQGDPGSSGEPDEASADHGPALGDADGGDQPSVDDHLDADPGEGGAAA